MEALVYCHQHAMFQEGKIELKKFSIKHWTLNDAAWCPKLNVLPPVIKLYTLDAGVKISLSIEIFKIKKNVRFWRAIQISWVWYSIPKKAMKSEVYVMSSHAGFEAWNKSRKVISSSFSWDKNWTPWMLLSCGCKEWRDKLYGLGSRDYSVFSVRTGLRLKHTCKVGALAGNY